eukprot:g16444.t1
MVPDGEKQHESMAEVKENGPVQISEQDERKYRHITLPNKMQVLLISDPETDKEAAAMDVHVGMTSDPSDLQGTAHFCEHMLFLGTGKYPDEKYFDALLNSNGGSSNAFTSDEHTNYHFDVNAGNLEGALDAFSRFFIDPLFTEGGTRRELTAIDNEHSKNLNSDSWRLNEVLKAVSSKKHPWHQFGTGNAKTLGEDPKKKGVDIRKKLLEFHDKYYSSNLMRLVMLGKADLDELQAMAVEKFSPVENKNAEKPSFGGNVPFGPEQVKRRINVVPVKESRDVLMSWPMPPIDKHYRSKPASYLSRLIGHEGVGSLLSLLKTKSWANDLTAGVAWDATDWSNFIVEVECTEEGIEHVDEIVSMTYQYLNMIREDGIQEWIHLETQAISAMNFRFSSKIDPVSYVLWLAGNMHTYRPEHTVAGASLRYEYNPELVRELLGHLVPGNMLLMVTTKDFTGQTDKVEPFYGTEYSWEPLPDNLIQSWEGCGRREELRLPEPNPVIATDFTLRPAPAQEGPVAPPSLIRDDEFCRLWHKTDGQFRKPKLVVEIRLVNPVQYQSPENLVLTELLASLLNEDLNEELYMARQAGLGLIIYPTKEAFHLSLGGYHHKMKVLLERAVNRLTSFGDSLARGKEEEGRGNEAVAGAGAEGVGGASRGDSPGLFQRVRQMLLKEYNNYMFRTPCGHAESATDSCLEVSSKWSNDDKIKVMEGDAITVSAMHDFIPRLFGVLYVEMLVQGNATAEEALELASVVVDGLKARPLPSNRFPEARVVDLSVRAAAGGAGQSNGNSLANSEEAWGSPQVATATVAGGTDGSIGGSVALNPEYRRSLACPNPKETTSAVCLDTLRGRALLNLFTHLLRDKCYAKLRTEEQLGYIVWSGAFTHGKGFVYSVQFGVQSNDRSPSYLDERVESFIAGFRETLTSLTKEEFAVNVRAVVESLLEKDKNLNEEASRHWKEITDRSYTFDRFFKDAAVVQGLSQGDLLEFFDHHFSLGGAGRRKLSTWVYGNKHKVPTDIPTAGEEEGGEGEDEAVDTVKEVDAAKGADADSAADDAGVAAAVAAGGGLSNGGRFARKLVVIEDYSEFKRSMPLLPLRKPTPVQALLVDHSKL